MSLAAMIPRSKMLYRKSSTAFVNLLVLFFSMMVAAMLLLTTSSLAQTAEFTADKTAGCFPLTVNFKDASIGAPTSWLWDFGNGNTSILQDPGAIYTLPGTYTVTLTVNAGASSKTKVGFIKVYSYPQIDFAFDKTSGCAPLQVSFTDQSDPVSGNAVEWFWVFGDGGTSTVANPNHTYTSSGNKTISLKVKNQFGCESTGIKAQAIQVEGPATEFQPSATAVCQVPAVLQFTNQTTGNAPLQYNWTFGDGAASTDKNPSHTYTQAGTYTVILRATDPSGCKSEVSHVVSAGSEGGLDFSRSASRLCFGKEVSFTLLAIKNYTNLTWDFGDGTNSAQANPSHTYTAPGTYQVTVSALLQNNTCTSIVTKSVEVLPDPIPDFTSAFDCNFKGTFQNTSAHASQWVWDVESMGGSSIKSPTFQFARAGSYQVELIAYNDLGCSISIVRSIVVPDKPIAQFLPALEQDCTAPSLSGCAPFAVPFTNISASTTPFKSEWTFGDGAMSTNKDQSHTYAVAGSYTVTLKISNSIGCTSSVSRKVTVSNITPVAKFKINKTTVCTREEVEFIDESTDANFWCWDFGDGETGMGKIVTHGYKKSGTYTVRLTAKNGGCSNTSEKINAIVVNSPEVDFKILKNCGNPNMINLQNLSTDFHSLEWAFGDGQTTAVNVSSHTYAAPGNYTVSLTAKNNSTNCSVKHSMPVSIYNLQSDFVIDNVKPCKGAAVRFTNTSTDAVRWQWNLGNQITSGLQNPITNYQTPGNYAITLRAFDADGCPKDKTLSVDVLDLRGDFTYTATSTCSELAVQFTDRSSGTPAISSWSWDFGNGQTSATHHPATVYTQLGSYPITLTLTNSQGTCSFIVYDAIPFTNPKPDFSTSKPGHCLNEKITITNFSQYASIFRWEFGDGTSATTDFRSQQVSYKNVGEYNVTLYAKDNYGCEKSIAKSSFIKITKPVADFDAFQTTSECPPLTSIFKDKSVGVIKNHFWNFGDGQKSTLADPANTYVEPGIFDVRLIVEDENKCYDTTVVAGLINVGGPTGDFSLGDHQRLCTNDSILFDGNSKNAATHEWDFGDGTIETKTTLSTKHIYPTTGVYKVALVLIDENGCKVNAKGDAQLTIATPATMTVSYPRCLFENDMLTLQTSSDEDIVSYNWIINNVSAGNESTVSIQLDSYEDREVSLQAINSSGCLTDTTTIVAVQGYIEKIPNVFTPNNADDTNVNFEILGVENSEWNLTVFNRWGRPVYEKKKYTNQWNGKDLPVGVYYYTLENNLCRDKKYKGPLSILR